MQQPMRDKAEQADGPFVNHRNFAVRYGGSIGNRQGFLTGDNQRKSQEEDTPIKDLSQ